MTYRCPATARPALYSWSRSTLEQMSAVANTTLNSLPPVCRTPSTVITNFNPLPTTLNNFNPPSTTLANLDTVCKTSYTTLNHLVLPTNLLHPPPTLLSQMPLCKTPPKCPANTRSSAMTSSELDQIFQQNLQVCKAQLTPSKRLVKTKKVQVVQQKREKAQIGQESGTLGKENGQLSKHKKPRPSGPKVQFNTKPPNAKGTQPKLQPSVDSVLQRNSCKQTVVNGGLQVTGTTLSCVLKQGKPRDIIIMPSYCCLH